MGGVAFELRCGGCGAEGDHAAGAEELVAAEAGEFVVGVFVEDGEAVEGLLEVIGDAGVEVLPGFAPETGGRAGGMAALGVRVDGRAGVDIWHGMTDLADGARGVAGDIEDGAFELGADGFWMAAEAIGGDRPVDAGPVDVNGFDERAEENRAKPEGVRRVVAHVGVVVVLRIDIPVL